ncbi:hypothetical protein KMU_00670 [Proteus vulgaris]|uniref:TIR domain-containing protein n=1 Tax=Proteus vulgaris TaxID=585 RepID=UPI002555DEE4|nr:TIR domain-containing protein [Proteus vulgaris]GLX62027.1 hypothetical protein KMU_00670 [Proteus vulgaris]
MAKKSVFYSFHYENDVFRVQQIRNIGVLEGNTPVNANEWETIKKRGRSAIQDWINENMKYKQCIIVLVGNETANREWVQYEIKKAWEDGKPIFGIYIHNLSCLNTGKSKKGKNPFDLVRINNIPLSNYVTCYDPNVNDAYNDIAKNISNWINIAIAERK